MPALRIILMSMFPKAFGNGTIHSRRTSHDPNFYPPGEGKQRQSGQSDYSGSNNGNADMFTPAMIAQRLQTPSPVKNQHSSWSSRRWSNYPHDGTDQYNGYSNSYRSYDVRYGTYQNGKMVWVNVNKPASPPPPVEEQPKSFFNFK
jgi:hypothetical protein